MKRFDIIDPGIDNGVPYLVETEGGPYVLFEEAQAKIALIVDGANANGRAAHEAHVRLRNERDAALADSARFRSFEANQFRLERDAAREDVEVLRRAMERIANETSDYLTVIARAALAKVEGRTGPDSERG